MKSSVLFVAVLALTTAPDRAGAAEATMPTMFVGDWCYASLDKKTTNYTLPSWTEGFYSEGWHCEPTRVQQKRDCAPSGCAHIASVTARCQPDGPVTSGSRKLYEFNRYKGNLYVTEK